MSVKTIDSDKIMEDAIASLKKTPLAKVLFPDDVCSLNSLSPLNQFLEIFNENLRIRSCTYAFPGIARWSHKGYLKIVYNSEAVVIWNICSDGMILKMTAVPYGVHLKNNLAENEILEKVNLANDISKQEYSGVCTVYDKASNCIYFKRSFLLPTSERFIREELFTHTGYDYENSSKIVADLFEID